jgi:hypothetical protein
MFWLWSTYHDPRHHQKSGHHILSHCEPFSSVSFESSSLSRIEPSSFAVTCLDSVSFLDSVHRWRCISFLMWSEHSDHWFTSKAERIESWSSARVKGSVWMPSIWGAIGEQEKERAV